MTKIFVFPGQGSQELGMGKSLFEQFPELVKQVDKQLGYSIARLCLEDTDGHLNQTQYTQVALYVVNGLSYLKKIGETGQKPDVVAGHSLGEYNALFASGAFDFLTGLKLVQKRGELMGKVSGSGMAAVIGITVEQIQQILQQSALATIDIANLNTSTQTVIAGIREDIEKAADVFRSKQAKYIILNVSGAFHSRYMENARREFAAFVENFSFGHLNIPVISNVGATAYSDDRIGDNLISQITSPVKWQPIVEYLLQKPQPEFEEVGPGKVLIGLINRIKRESKREYTKP